MFFKIIVGIVVFTLPVMAFIYALLLIVSFFISDKPTTYGDVIDDSREEDLNINIKIRIEEPKKEMTLQEKRYAE